MGFRRQYECQHNAVNDCHARWKLTNPDGQHASYLESLALYLVAKLVATRHRAHLYDAADVLLIRCRLHGVFIALYALEREVSMSLRVLKKF